MGGRIERYTAAPNLGRRNSKLKYAVAKLPTALPGPTRGRMSDHRNPRDGEQYVRLVGDVEVGGGWGWGWGWDPFSKIEAEEIVQSARLIALI